MTVVRRRGESMESLLKRFRKSVSKNKILSTVRKKRYHITRGERARIKKRKGIQRARRRALKKAARLNRRRR
ncbi:MAG: 30S ribosomal protein S21 [Chloroflexota bacterium]